MAPRTNQPLTQYQKSIIMYRYKKGKSPDEIRNDEVCY